MKKRVLCFGDSLTWGADPKGVCRLEERWPMVLQERLGPDYTVVEEGQGGRVIATDDFAEGEENGLKYILPCLESHDPLDLVAIMLGTNDCKQKFGYCPQDIAFELGRFLEKVQGFNRYRAARRFKVLVIAPPYISEGVKGSWLEGLFGGAIPRSRQLPPLFKDVAERYGCLFMDGNDCAVTSAVDGIHLDPDQQIRLGEAVAEVVRRELDTIRN